MGGRNLNPARVYQTAAALLECGSIQQPPVWFKTIGSIPPSEILTRTQPPIHRDRNSRPISSKRRKPSKMFKPLPIEYEEDQLRHEFYRDHPWELARPRIVLENDGKDGQKCNWAQIQQHGRQLNGESVVQRQLYLINEEGKAKTEAYDIARKEFYALRHEEEVEQRVAREEALWTGAYFGMSRLDISMQLEDKTYEGWKKWATEKIQLFEQQKDAAYTSTPDTEEVAPTEDFLDEAPVPEEPPKTTVV
ncbi:mitochondrial ribosomal protein S25 [Tricladium varicosporioides]|nr:mitochondrial ribosomal protein S25 [Hymenoscyphus varicosporioides]